jgi:hypothetical protein
MTDTWESVTMKAGRYHMTLPRSVVESAVGVIGSKYGPQANNVFNFCYERLLQTRPDADKQPTYGITFNEPEKLVVKRNNMWLQVVEKKNVRTRRTKAS